jgi:hypothetical protein
MSNTSIQGPYTAHTATNLTQTITRISSAQAISSIILTPSPNNYTRVYTLTFTISGLATPSNISIDSTIANGIPFTRVSSTVITVSSQYNLPNGVTVNNWPYFQLLLQNLRIITSGSTWPNPAFTISTSLSDGTTSLTGSISVGSLNAVSPTTPTLSATRPSASSVALTWTLSTQSTGTGVTGYYIYKNGSSTPTVDVTSGLTWTDSSAGTGVTTYMVRAHDGASTITVSADSNVITTQPLVYAPTITFTRNWSANTISLSWPAATNNYGSSSAISYNIYKGDLSTLLTTTTSLSYNDPSTTNADTIGYVYFIRATQDGIVGTSSAQIALPATVPTSPTIVGGWDSGTSSVQVTISVPSTQTSGPGISGYTLYGGYYTGSTAGVPNYNWTQIGSWSGVSTHYFYWSLIPGYTNEYMVKAYDLSTPTPQFSAASNHLY